MNGRHGVLAKSENTKTSETDPSTSTRNSQEKDPRTTEEDSQSGALCGEEGKVMVQHKPEGEPSQERQKKRWWEDGGRNERRRNEE